MWRRRQPDRCHRRRKTRPTAVNVQTASLYGGLSVHEHAVHPRRCLLTRLESGPIFDAVGVEIQPGQPTLPGRTHPRIGQLRNGRRTSRRRKSSEQLPQTLSPHQTHEQILRLHGPGASPPRTRKSAFPPASPGPSPASTALNESPPGPRGGRSGRWAGPNGDEPSMTAARSRTGGGVCASATS